jgi:CRP-like cAMP-binding protein
MHDLIYRENDPSDKVYFIITGEIEISKSETLPDLKYLGPCTTV